MEIRSQRDFWSGLMFVALGLGFAYGALDYPSGSSESPGPGFFPYGLGLILAALGALTLLKAMTVHTVDGEPVGEIAWRPLGKIIGAVALFGISLPWLGMLIALPLLVIITARAGEEFHWREALVNAAILTFGSWAIFAWGLNLEMPLVPAFLSR